MKLDIWRNCILLLAASIPAATSVSQITLEVTPDGDTLRVYTFPDYSPVYSHLDVRVLPYGGGYQYVYTLSNDASSTGAIKKLWLFDSEPCDSVDVLGVWRSTYSQRTRKLAYFIRSNDDAIDPGEFLTFACYTSNLPVIRPFLAVPWRSIPQLDLEPDIVLNPTVVSGLTQGHTIAPALNASETGLLAVVDTLGLQVLSAVAQQWLDEETIANDVLNRISKGRNSLAFGDSVNSANEFWSLSRQIAATDSTIISNTASILLTTLVDYIRSRLPSPSFQSIGSTAAITVHADLLNESIDPRFDGNSLLVDGRNHAVDGTLVPGAADLPGIVTGSSYAYNELLAAVGSNQDDNIVGAGSAQPNIIQDELDLDVDPFIAAALESADVVTVSGSVGEPLGSLEAPVVVYADSNIDITGNTAGYGLLIVDGDVKISGDASWTGLIIVRTRPDLVSGFTIQGDARVIGSVIISQTANLPARFFVRGNAQVLYSSEAVDLAAEAMGW